MKSGFYKWIKISFIVFSFAILLVASKSVVASSTDNVFGWWWSDNIGWISLNNCANPASCSGNNYGVNINEDTNIVSGHAWSDNIGWISFDQNDWSDDSNTAAPPGGFSSGGNQIGSSGWGRALNGRYFAHPSDGRDNRGGYDGWISLSGFGIDKTTDLSSGLSGFVNKVVNPLTGYGWGSNVIGWVQAGSKYHKSYVSFDKKCLITDPTCPKHDHNFFELTINGKNTASIVGGEKVDIVWTAKNNFYPTECIGAKGGSSPYPDSSWTTKVNGFTFHQTSDTYNKMHVSPSGSTTFKLSCTDGTNTYYDEVDVSATFTAGINGGACIDDLTTNPTITWTTNDLTPECTILAEPFYADFTPYTIPSSGYLNASGTPPYTVVDTSYNHKNTFYKLNCRNGDTGTYEANVGPVTGFTKMCSKAVDYDISKDSNACNYVVQDKVDPKLYKAATTTLTLTPNNFTADADVTEGAHTGTLSFSPSRKFTYNTTYNDINIDYSITANEIADLIQKSKIINKKYLPAIDLEINATTQNTTTKTESLVYCFDTDTLCTDQTDPKCVCPKDPTNPMCKPPPPPPIKPKYVPF